MQPDLFTENDRNHIRQWSNTLNKPIQLTLVDSIDSRAEEFNRFCRTFSSLVSEVSTISEKGDADTLPEIRIGKRLI